MEQFTNQKTKLGMITILGFVALVALFQNCSGGGFIIDPNALNQTSLASVAPKTVGTTLASFKSCRMGTADFYTCLEANSDIKGVLKASDVSNCTAVVGASTPTDLDIAMCLTKVGFPIFNYREPLQHDIETCSTNVGVGKIAACLSKNAILPATVNQAVIDSCIAAVGIANVEKCLRKNAHLPKVPFVSNADIALCSKVSGQMTGLSIFTCLSNRELLPATVVQADIDTCLLNAPTTIAKCLRTAKKVARVIMQNNINGCVSAVGETKIGACLDSNGYLYEALLPAATLQTTIDACVTAVGPTAVAKCLRTRKVLETSVMQAQIASCIAAVGSDKVVACLTANGLVDAVTGLASNSLPGFPLLQADVDACVIAAGPTGVARCLTVVKKVLNPASGQDQFSFCARVNDPTGIAACLDGSGMLPLTPLTGLPTTQANFDTCVAAVGVAGLETCMRNRGFIP